MAEYVSREDILDIASQYCTDDDGSCSKADVDIKEMLDEIEALPAVDVQPVDKDAVHIVYIGRKAYLAENTIMEFMKKMDIIRDSLAHVESYFNTYAETIRQIRACVGECTDISEVKYFIDSIKANSRYN